jgi:hypothetical protein
MAPEPVEVAAGLAAEVELAAAPADLEAEGATEAPPLTGAEVLAEAAVEGAAEVSAGGVPPVVVSGVVAPPDEAEAFKHALEPPPWMVRGEVNCWAPVLSTILTLTWVPAGTSTTQRKGELWMLSPRNLMASAWD